MAQVQTVLVGATTQNIGSSGTRITSVVLNVPTGTQSGDLLIVHIGMAAQADKTITPPAGWDLVLDGSYQDAALKGWIYSRRASAEPASYTWTLSATAVPTSSMSAWRNAVAVDVVKGWQTQLAANTTTTTDISTTSTVQGRVLRFIHWMDNSTSLVGVGTAATGPTEAVDTAGSAATPSELMATAVYYDAAEQAAGAVANQNFTCTPNAGTIGSLQCATVVLKTSTQLLDTFTATGTWTAPDGVTAVEVECWGGGGGGGSGTGNPACGGGAAGGSYARTDSSTVVPGTIYTVTVGAAQATAATVGNDSWLSGNNVLSDNNSSFETDVSGWGSPINCTVARSTNRALSGVASMEMTPTTTTTSSVDLLFSNWPAGLPGEVWEFGFYANPSVASTTAVAKIAWEDSAFAQISQTAGSTISLTADGWTRVSVSGVAPANTAWIKVFAVWDQVATTDRLYVDSVWVAKAATLAKGGAAGGSATTNSSNGAAGAGSTTNCVGDVKFAGGNGVAGVFSATTGGAGGGGAGSTGVGGNGSGGTGGTGTSSGGGAGGAVGALGVAGGTGVAAGGGGGGGNANAATDRLGGGGARGEVRVTYEANVISQTVIQNAALMHASTW